MNSFVVFVAIVASLQAINAQFITPVASPLLTSPLISSLSPFCSSGLSPFATSPIISLPGATIVQTDSVANNLADTLSLLTVSNLLADTLPYGYPMVSSLPLSAPLSYGGCGCGGLSYVF